MSRLRLDRLLSLSVFRLSGCVLGHHPRIPILMYHSIREGISDRRRYYDINTSPRQFVQHMKFLKDEGFRSVHLSEAVNALASDQPDFDKCVAITFDDGYRDFATDAYPVLSRFDQTATLFVPSGLIQDQRARFLGRDCLTWGELRELHKKGIQIGSHSVTHRELKAMSKADLEEEVVRSKNMIEDKLGQAVTSFSYPYAFPETDAVFTKALREMLRDHGYENGVTTILGTANRLSDRFFLPRVPANSWDDLALLRAKLEGSYDWLHSAQFLTKKIKRLFRPTKVPTTVREFGRI